MLKNIKIEDGDIFFNLVVKDEYIKVSFEQGTKQLTFEWAQDFCLSIYDSSREDMFSSENMIIDFQLPINSIFYDIFRKNIPNDYVLYADNKPKISNKHAKFSFDTEGVNILVDTDNKSEFSDISSMLTFYGYCGGSSQRYDYKDAFVYLLREIIEFSEKYSGPKKIYSI